MRNDHFADVGKVIVARRWRSGPDDAAKGIAVNCWLDRKALTALVNDKAVIPMDVQTFNFVKDW